MTLAQVVLAAVLVERLCELLIAQRNTRALLDQGAVEHGAAHYPFVVLLHAAWLAALVLVVPATAAVDWLWLGAYLVLQAGRAWVMMTLGRLWTTRIITLPGAPLIEGGPYRLVRHPNYIVVAGEIAVLPLVFGEWRIALVFSALNGLALYERIRVENEALAPRRRSAAANDGAPGGGI
ncbi:MAG: isoprenylcysteine carboxyl methyltransferase family protein [Pseudomonadota bacterium]